MKVLKPFRIKAEIFQPGDEFPEARYPGWVEQLQRDGYIGRITNFESRKKTKDIPKKSRFK